MNTAQRVIKAFALCLAGFIILVMFGAVISLVGFLAMLSGSDFSYTPPSVIWQEEIGSSESTAQVAVRKLKVSVGATDLRIVETTDAEKVRVESNNGHVVSWQDYDTLQVVEKSHFSWFDFANHELVIYLPAKYQFEEVEIDAGAGRVEISRLAANRVKFELGAGKTEIDYLEAFDDLDIEGGAGSLEIKDGKLKSSEIEIGAGRAAITAQLIGDSKISSGVGRVELNLKATPGDYKFSVDKGIGAVTIDGVSQNDDATYGQGNNLIKLDCGVGSVEVRTVE